MKTFRRWYWLIVPLLAIAAYVSVLDIGFLSDDFILLYEGQESGIDPRIFVPRVDWYIYRPLGMMLVWQVGWQLWGYNPLPFHIQGLLLHAGVSLVLGLWLATITSRPRLGWLAGALFAVFPLHLEAVGWAASQWDVLAALLGLLSLWLFAFWWTAGGHKPWYAYLLSVLFYGMAIFAKESLITFLPLFPISAWAATRQSPRKIWPGLFMALLPFAGLFALNIGLRLAYWGHLGGYASTRIDFIAALPSMLAQLPNYMWLLAAPLNPALFGQTVPQVVGTLVAIALLAALLRYGGAEWVVLAIAAAWLAVTLLPVLFLPVIVSDLQNNRFLYLPTAGYLIAVAALLDRMLMSARRLRPLVLSLIGLLLALGVVLSWLQLGPWRTASATASDLRRDLRAMLPLWSRSDAAVWYVEDLPDNYKGAYIYRLGFGLTQYFNGANIVSVKTVSDALTAPIVEENMDAFALRFRYDKPESRFAIDYAKGITGENPPPTSREGANGLQVWDFRGCAADVIAQWQVVQAQPLCEPGKGLALRQSTSDAQMLATNLSLSLSGKEHKWIRLRVSVQYPPAPEPVSYLSQWYWKGSGEEWSEEHSFSMLIKQDGKSHTYWTFIPVEKAPNGIEAMRFDPVNGKVDATVQWIAVDQVE